MTWFNQPISIRAEVFLAAAAGMIVIVLPVATDPLHTPHSAAFLPLVGAALKYMKLYSLGLLVGVGLLFGFFGRGPVLLIGPATILVAPIWSIIDMSNGGSHNLFPIEWLFYGVFSLPGLLGAGIGRVAKRIASRRHT